MQSQMGKVSLRFAWFDLWIGAFYDQKERVIYICPIPTVVVRIAIKDNERGKSYEES